MNLGNLESLRCAEISNFPNLPNFPKISIEKNGLDLSLGLHLDIMSLGATVGRDNYIEADAPIVLQRAETIALDGCIVDIDIDTITACDKAITSLGIEPLDTSLHSCKFKLQCKVTKFISLSNTIGQFFAFYL